MIVPPRILLLAVTAVSTLAAQETTGNLRGTISDASGRPLPAVTVRATSASLLGARTGVSAADGVYLLRVLPPGTYTLRVQAIGFRPVVIDSVRIRLGATSQAPDVRLEASTVVLEPSRIVAPPFSLDPERTTVGATLEAADLAGLPGDRDHTALVATLPHANTSYHGDPVNVGGATGLENAYFIDGVNVTAPFRANRGTALPFNFVRSVEVRSGGYEAQYGRALGAIVNAITHTGTNRFESDIFGFYTSEALASESRMQPTLSQRGLVAYDVGARLSGPIARDLLWFSAAYNPRVERKERTIIGLGSFADAERADIFAAKLTWQAASRSMVELSVFGDPRSRDGVEPPVGGSTLFPTNPDPYLMRVRTGGVSAALRAHSMLGASVMVEASVSQARGRDDLLPRTEVGRTEEPYIDRFNGTVGGGFQFPTTAAQRVTTFAARATMTAQRHLIVGGVELEDTFVDRTLRGGAGLGQVTRVDATTYRTSLEAADGSFRNAIPTFFVQDAWRATPRLTLSGGVRWSRQSMYGASGELAQRLTDEWQPRLGFSLQLDGARRARLFGSAGRFYQQVPLNLSSLYYVLYPWIVASYTGDPRLPGSVETSREDWTSRESDFAGTADGASAEHTDEFTLGYERLLGARATLTVRGLHKSLRGAFQQGMTLTPFPLCPYGFCVGTPGVGALGFLPRVRREYSGLEIGVVGTTDRFRYRASYVLSRNRGNFAGLFGSDKYFGNPGIDYGLTFPYQALNSTGALPNDQPHVAKLSGVWSASDAMTVGAVFTWASGTPLNEFGVGPNENVFFPAFLVPRGSAGRMPSILDTDLRLSYAIRSGPMGGARLTLDALHLGNRQTTVRVDQQRYFDAARMNPNPGYGVSLLFTPAASYRLGVQWTR